MHDLLAPAVVERDVQLQARVVLRLLHGGIQRLLLTLQSLGHVADIAQDADADVLAVQLVQLLGEVFQQKPHQRANLLGGALPVLSGERIDGQGLDAQVIRMPDNLAQRLHAGLVAKGTRHAALLRPAAVAIHDDGDMARQQRPVKRHALHFILAKDSHTIPRFHAPKRRLVRPLPAVCSGFFMP